MENRLSKVLAAAGIASRRACEELIFAGKVCVNGKVVTKPQERVQLGRDEIFVGARRVMKKQKNVTYALHKPKGFICTSKPAHGVKRVIDLFPDVKCRLFTAGRLDKDTTGLLIVTTDGHFAHRLIHPSSNISKEYMAKVQQEILHEHLLSLSHGMEIEGAFVQPKKVVKVRKGTVKITVMEGKKREVRLLLQHAGLDVISLKRIRIGCLHLHDLPEGSWRELTQQEKMELCPNDCAQ